MKYYLPEDDTKVLIARENKIKFFFEIRFLLYQN